METEAGLVIKIGAFDTAALSRCHASQLRGLRQDLIAALGYFRAWTVRDAVSAHLVSGIQKPSRRCLPVRGPRRNGGELDFSLLHLARPVRRQVYLERGCGDRPRRMAALRCEGGETADDLDARSDRLRTPSVHVTRHDQLEHV